MRAWLYERLTQSTELQTAMGYNSSEILTQIKPRQSQSNLNWKKPFLIYGLGNNTNEDLSEDPTHEANRQFFQIWIHDEGGDYTKIDNIIPVLKALLIGASDKNSKILTIRWLENSQEFANETYNTIFRYCRFQAIIAKGTLS